MSSASFAGESLNNIQYLITLTLSGPGFFWVPGLGGGGGGGGRRVPSSHNSETIHDIEMELARVVEDHKLINLV